MNSLFAWDATCTTLNNKTTELRHTEKGPNSHYKLSNIARWSGVQFEDLNDQAKKKKKTLTADSER